MQQLILNKLAKAVGFVLLAVFCFGLGGCVSPGLKYYTKVKTIHPKTGKEGYTTKLIYAVGSDVVGDQKITVAANGAVTHEITTPRDKDGSILVEEIPILNKDRTAVIATQKRPLVASVNTSGPINAWGNLGRKLWSGFNNFAGTIFTGWAGVEATQGASTAVELVKP